MHVSRDGLITIVPGAEDVAATEARGGGEDARLRGSALRAVESAASRICAAARSYMLRELLRSPRARTLHNQIYDADDLLRSIDAQMVVEGAPASSADAAMVERIRRQRAQDAAELVHFLGGAGAGTGAAWAALRRQAKSKSSSAGVSPSAHSPLRADGARVRTRQSVLQAAPMEAQPAPPRGDARSKAAPAQRGAARGGGNGRATREILARAAGRVPAVAPAALAAAKRAMSDAAALPDPPIDFEPTAWPARILVDVLAGSELMVPVGAHPAATARKQPYVELALVVDDARNGRTRRTAAWRGAERAKRNPVWRGERFVLGPLSLKGSGALTEPGALSRRRCVLCSFVCSYSFCLLIIFFCLLLFFCCLRCVLKLQLLDGDRFASDTFMGQCAIPLSVLDGRSDVTAWYALERRKRGRANGVVHGRIQVRLRGMPVDAPGAPEGSGAVARAAARASAEAEPAVDVWAAEAPRARSGAVRALGTRRARGAATTPRSAARANAESKERPSSSARGGGESAKEAAAPKKFPFLKRTSRRIETPSRSAAKDWSAVKSKTDSQRKAPRAGAAAGGARASTRRAGARAAPAQPQQEARPASRAERSASSAARGGPGHATSPTPSLTASLTASHQHPSPRTFREHAANIPRQHLSPRRVEARAAPLAGLDPLDTSARRGTYFGTYSGDEAATLRRSERTKSTLDGVGEGRAAALAASHAPVERTRSRIVAEARERARRRGGGSAPAAARASAPPPGLSLSRDIISASLACADADEVDLADAVATLPSIFDRIQMRPPPQSEARRLSRTHLGALEEEYRHLRRW